MKTRSRRSPYELVLASLPRHGALFSARRPPVSRIVLDRRLALLSDADRGEVGRIEQALSWPNVQAAGDDHVARRRIEDAAKTLRSPALRRIVGDRLSMRVVVAALRRRIAGEAAPARTEDALGAPLAARIRRSWSSPGFRLGPSEAWAARADQMLSAHDSLGAERAILGEVWRRLTRARARHPNGFEALAIYLMQWALIDRWTRLDAAQSKDRFAAWVSGVADAAGAKESQ